MCVCVCVGGVKKHWLPPHLTMALEELAPLSDVRQKMQKGLRALKRGGKHRALTPASIFRNVTAAQHEITRQPSACHLVTVVRPCTLEPRQ